MESKTNTVCIKTSYATKKMKKYLLLVILIILLIQTVNAQSCEDEETRPCASTFGRCSEGEQICSNGFWGPCSIAPLNSELCDNQIDDDCDGLVDEGCGVCDNGDTETCGTDVGACKLGAKTCVNEQWSACIGSISQTTERCNNQIDDDCDGLVDEDCDQTSNCLDRIKNFDEEGVDCGGSCPNICPSCLDGIPNQGEKRTAVDLGNGTISDCGGPFCPTCPTCSDFIKNQGEENIDCGGPCQPCSDPSVLDSDNDGLTNQVELLKGTDPNNPDSNNDGIIDSLDPLPLCGNQACETDADPKENQNNCPADCGRSLVFPFIILLVFLIPILIIVVYLIFQKRKKKKKIKPQKIHSHFFKESPKKSSSDKLAEELQKKIK